MKKLFLSSILLLFTNLAAAQVIQARVLDIEPINLEKMKYINFWMLMMLF